MQKVEAALSPWVKFVVPTTPVTLLDVSGSVPGNINTGTTINQRTLNQVYNFISYMLSATASNQQAATTALGTGGVGLQTGQCTHMYVRHHSRYRLINTGSTRAIVEIWKAVYRHDTTANSGNNLSALIAHQADYEYNGILYPSSIGSNQSSAFQQDFNRKLFINNKVFQHFKVSRKKRVELGPGETCTIHETHRGKVFSYPFVQQQWALTTQGVQNMGNYTYCFLYRVTGVPQISNNLSSGTNIATYPIASVAMEYDEAYTGRMVGGFWTRQKLSFFDTSASKVGSSTVNQILPAPQVTSSTVGTVTTTADNYVAQPNVEV